MPLLLNHVANVRVFENEGLVMGFSATFPRPSHGPVWGFLAISHSSLPLEKRLLEKASGSFRMAALPSRK